MAFLKRFECRSCGSTLGRLEWSPGKRGLRAMCFVCCMGDFEMSHRETRGLDAEVARSLSTREPGSVGSILARLHTPGGVMRESVMGSSAEMRSSGLSTHKDPIIEQIEIAEKMECKK